MEWISIKQRLPEKDVWVLAIDKFNEQRVCRFEKHWESEPGEWYYSHMHIMFPTHWMPLPKKPEQ